MIYFIPVFVIILGVIFFLSLKNIEGKQNKILGIFIIVNVFIMILIHQVLPLGFKIFGTMWSIWIVVAINVIGLLILFISKIKLNTRKTMFLLTFYILLMLFIPTHKFHGHRHEKLTTLKFEKIVEYTEFYNIYGINIYTIEE